MLFINKNAILIKRNEANWNRVFPIKCPPFVAILGLNYQHPPATEMPNSFVLGPQPHTSSKVAM